MPSFTRYLLSRGSAPFLFILCWSIALILSVYTLTGLPRWILSIPYLTFSPGYSLITLLNDGVKLGVAEKLALSLGLSLCVVAILGLMLSLTPLGVTPTSVAVLFTAFTMMVLLASTCREYLRKAA